VSQAGIINTSSGPVPPSVPTSFQTDINDTTVLTDPPAFAGTSVPALNVLRVAGDDGIKTVTIPNSPSGTKNLVVRFVQGEAHTTSNETAAALVQAVATDTTFTTQILVAAFSSGSVLLPASNNKSYGAYTTVTLNNTAGITRLVNTVDFFKNTDIELTAANVTVTVTGLDANFTVTVTGQTSVPMDWTIILPGIAQT